MTAPTTTDPVQQLLESLVAQKLDLQERLASVVQDATSARHDADAAQSSLRDVKVALGPDWSARPSSLAQQVESLRLRDTGRRERLAAIRKALGDAAGPEEDLAEAVQRLRASARSDEDLAEQFKLGYRAGHEERGALIPEGMMLVSEDEWVTVTSKAEAPPTTVTFGPGVGPEWTRCARCGTEWNTPVMVCPNGACTPPPSPLPDVSLSTEEQLNTLKEHRDYLLRQVQGARREFAKCWHIDPDDSLADLVVRLRRERSEARREAKGAGDATDVTGPGGTVLRRDLAIAISEHRDQPGVPSTWVGWDSCIVRLLESEPMQRLRKVWLAQDRIEGPAALPAIDPGAPKPESHGPCEVCGTSWVGDITACPGCQAGRERAAAYLASSEYLTKAYQWVQKNQWYAKGGVVNPTPPTSGGNPTDGTNP